MKHIWYYASIACVLAAFIGQACAETAIPKGGTMATNAKALKSYSPTVNPGYVDFSVPDRAAIANLIHAYAFAYDNGAAQTWFGLFTADAVFVAGLPGEEPIAFTGDGFREFWTDRLKEFAASGDTRRHLMSNILFLDQTAETAHVSVGGLLTNAKDGKSFDVVTSLNYEGWLVKGVDGWKIQRWHDFPDVGVGQ